MAEPPEALIAAIEADESLPAAPGSGYQPLAEAVTRQVRAAILDGRLAPGTRIRQEEIARRLGTSRIPVREALAPARDGGPAHAGPPQRRARLGARLRRVHRAVPHARGGRADGDRRERAAHDRRAARAAARARRAHRGRGRRPVDVARLRPALPPRELRRGAAAARAQAHRALLEPDAAVPARVLLHDPRRAWTWSRSEHNLILNALERRDGADAESLQRSHIRRTRTTLAPHAELFQK